jgi:hypothetical protein
MKVLGGRGGMFLFFCKLQEQDCYRCDILHLQELEISQVYGVPLYVLPHVVLTDKQ